MTKYIIDECDWQELCNGIACHKCSMLDGDVCRIDKYLQKQPIYEKRPYGKWVHFEDYDYLDENGVEHFHIKCPICGFLHDCLDCHTAQYDFCPNCGTDMREGDEK